MKSLIQYIRESDIDEDPKLQDALPGGINIALVGEICYYSNEKTVFKERKEAIAEYYKKNIRQDIDWNADYISKTSIFKHYVDDVLKFYKKDVDENCKLNTSSMDELKRQIANEIIMLAKNTYIR